MGTFHSVFARLLRVEADKLGYPTTSPFTIQTIQNVLRAIVKEMNLDDKLYKVNSVYNRISAAKNTDLLARYHDNTNFKPMMPNGRPKLGKIYDTYVQRCFVPAPWILMTFCLTCTSLSANLPDVLYKYQHKFRYILIDEYQDTNYAQYLIVKQFAQYVPEYLCGG